MPDAAESLPSAPPFNFPHIPYYAIGCTLDDIAARSGGRMTVEVIGQSALGRDMYLVTINELKTSDQRRDFANWRVLRALSLSQPAKAQQLLGRFGDDVKVPLYIQGGIHGNEYEGVDANMLTIERLATTPYGTDPEVDRILDHSVVLFNVIQNPDGRINGLRQNGNGFDLNRDFLTQAQPETKASVSVMQKWQPPDMLDLHGYLDPVLLIEATTKPHNPGIEYDLWLKWNQDRIDANEAALAVRGFGVQRPINDWCADAGFAYPYANNLCPTDDETISDDGLAPGPAAAEGWDDWGPFYTPMYSQLVGMNGSTVEMCRLENEQCEGRLGARIQQENITWSTLLFNVQHRHDVLMDEFEIYKRNVNDAPRPACCPPPFGAINNWMHDYPKAFLIPVGAGQRSDPEANRLVEWLLVNGAKVEELERDTRFNGRRYEEGSYVVWIDQARRGLIDTALDIGVDISDRAEILYAPPGAWSHGYLWGADVVTVGDGARFSPETEPIRRPNRLDGGIASFRDDDDDDDRRSRRGGGGRVAGYLLELDSPTAVRAANGLIAGGLSAQLVTTPFTTRTGGSAPAGSVIFPASAIRRLDDVGEDNGLWFHPVRRSLPSGLETIDRVPRIAVIGTQLARAGSTTPGVDQNVWSLRSLGFVADPYNAVTLDAAATDPLTGYDVVFSPVNWPASPPNPPFTVARQRVADFVARGGAFISVGTGGAAMLAGTGQVSGLTALANSGGGFGYSGIINWSNSGGAGSVVTGAYPALDTAIVDPPTWFTGIPTTMRVDGSLPLAPFLSGLAPFDWSQASGRAVIAHGTNNAGNARITSFAMNPLYRADPEREWPMLGSALYWVDQ
jgi:Zinc carboxypeptidase